MLVCSVAGLNRGVLLLEALTLLFLPGCHHRAGLPDLEGLRPAAIPVPGAPDGCTAAFLAVAAPLADTDGFRMFPGELIGPEWGACLLAGPIPEGQGPPWLDEAGASWLWILLAWQPAWRGEIACVSGDLSSPVLSVGEPDLPVPPWVEVKWYAAGVLQGGEVPSSVAPCPSGAPF